MAHPADPTAALTLRKPRVEDAADIAAYMADERVFGNLLQLPHPSEAMWTERLKSPPEGAFSLVAVRDEHVVGMAGVYPYARDLVRRKHVYHLGMSVAVAHHRTGVGDALMRELMQAADHWLGVLRIELEVFSDNAAAIALYEKHGFVREGMKRKDSLRAGVYADSVQMGRLHPKPPAL
jgi:L-phenylalanine/L-methionine N-acetyltransferase